MPAATTEEGLRHGALDRRIAALLDRARELGRSDDRIIEALSYVLEGITADRNLDALLDEVRTLYREARC